MVFNKSSKKGQAAIEFLMTYGWMLLVVLIVGALIFSFVDFGSLLPNQLDLTNSFRGDAQRMVAIQGVPDPGVTNNGLGFDFQFVVQYIGSRAGTLTPDFTVGSNNPNVDAIAGKTCNLISITDASGGNVNESSAAVKVSFVNGQNSVFSYHCGFGTTGLVEGDLIEGDILITYSDPRSPSLTLRSTGAFRVPITA